MREPIRVALPAEKAVLEALRAGDEVRLWGVVYTARDATHERIAAELRRSGVLPYGLQGQVLFYAGPTPARPRVAGGSHRSHDGAAHGRMDARAARCGRHRHHRQGCTERRGVARVREKRRSVLRCGGRRCCSAGFLCGRAEVVAWPELGTRLSCV